MAKSLAKYLGILLIVVGLAGFVAPGLLGAHLMPAHNVIHLVTGALALWFGTRGSLSGAKAFDIAFGAVYGLLGVAGFAFGSSVLGDANHLDVIPGVLMLGTVDHVIHLILGAAFLTAGLATHPLPSGVVHSHRPH